MKDLLGDALAEIVSGAISRNISLIIGGGYGLVLAVRELRRHQTRTLRPIPRERSTHDLDLFLSADLITDEGRITDLRDLLREMGYQPVQGAEYYQFSREVEYGSIKQIIKVDLLAPLPADMEQQRKIKYDKRRIRPRGVQHFHAHLVPEAAGIGEFSVPIWLHEDIAVRIPHPYSYAILKLLALRDRIDDMRREYGRYHAFDIYTIVAMITERQWQEALFMHETFPDANILHEAKRIVHDFFADANSRGTAAMREHAR